MCIVQHPCVKFSKQAGRQGPTRQCCQFPAPAAGTPTKPFPPTSVKWPLRPVLKNAQAYRKKSADAYKGAHQQLPGKALKSSLVATAFAAREDTVVRFLLLRAHNLDPIDDRKSCWPYVVFKLDNEKYTSKASRTVARSA
ncbi:hypothetical protein HPB49_012587 [Dermacentor silvarum]|uniref:Uncharacterized protein n=1 Tax=Dermacentor silvarum TaxID=543639 RepID=A0ACB8E002_DERSI|nr:hypothetical protein HPB49_012587 [Dermacentor silvarum]